MAFRSDVLLDPWKMQGLSYLALHQFLAYSLAHDKQIKGHRTTKIQQVAFWATALRFAGTSNKPHQSPEGTEIVLLLSMCESL